MAGQKHPMIYTEEVSQLNFYYPSTSLPWGNQINWIRAWAVSIIRIPAAPWLTVSFMLGGIAEAYGIGSEKKRQMLGPLTNGKPKVAESQSRLTARWEFCAKAALCFVPNNNPDYQTNVVGENQVMEANSREGSFGVTNDTVTVGSFL